jgi:hypothetical protein
MPENPEIFEKLNDYTLSVTNDFERQAQADRELRRIFNFKARQVTTIFSQWFGHAVSNTMDVKNFSQLDSLEEVELMRRKLIDLGGRPPVTIEGEQSLDKPSILPAGRPPRL